MTCKCGEMVDKRLAGLNTRLSYMFGIMPIGRHQAVMVTSVQIATVKINEKKRGKAIAVAAQFCPFCGLCNSCGLSADSHKKDATRITCANDQKPFAALARVPVERAAPSTNFPLWRSLD